jgi:acetyl-CoA C-acetyltransferase
MTKGIKDRVAIIGMGCTKFGELWDKSANDLIIDATFEALEDAGLSLKDIPAAWVGTVRQEVGPSLTVPLRMQHIPVTHIENRCATGIDTLRNACYAVAAGIHDIALVVGFEKLKDTGEVGVTGRGDECSSPYQIQAYASGPPARFAIRATRYFETYGLSPEEGKRLIAKIMVKNHHNGSLCPRAHFHNELTLEQVINAPIVASPLGLYDCCGVSDGAAAAVICSAEVAKRFRGDPVFIKAITVDSGPAEDYTRNDAGLIHFEETIHAARRAYEEAGIENPAKEISMAEVHDCFSSTELITYEDLGFCPRGQGKEYVERGHFELSGKLPVNMDGGLKCFGHPVGASGLRMTYELYKQLQGKADLPSRQLKNPKLGLAHNLGGALGAWVAGITIVGL